MLQINISINTFISFTLSLLIFVYFYSFKDKKPHLNMYAQLFLSFVFSGLFLMFFNKELQYSENFILAASFIFFLGFIFFTYKKYGSNLDFFYFVLISFYVINFFFYYLITKYSHIFITLSENPYPVYLILIISSALIIFHKNKQAHNNVVFYSYFLPFIYSISTIFFNGFTRELFSTTTIAGFFIIHFINAQRQVYTPLLKKLADLESQKKNQEALMPEHIKQKFQILEHNKAKLMGMAYTDKMTGVSNKDKVISQIKDLIKDPRVNVFSILMFDIDNFKNINDNLGHLVGDECIISMARLGEESIRKNDFIGRYGGDEFIIVLPNLDAYEAKIIAERLRQKIAQQTKPKFTISIGVASFPGDGLTFKELLESADKALYISKEKGKNKVSHVKLY